MGYDRAITMFSPDGRLLQVEYAKKTVRQGSTAIGIATKEGVVLLADKRLANKLIVADAIEKIFKVDDHVGATASGIISDARVLIEMAQVKAQQHRFRYDVPMDILSIVKEICNLKQLCTQSGGLRPFGVSVLVAGVDNGTPKLFETDPTGIYFQYKATAIGEGEVEIEDFLNKKYKEDMSVDDALKLALQALKKVVDEKLELERLDGAYIRSDEKKYKKFSKETLKETVDSLK